MSEVPQDPHCFSITCSITEETNDGVRTKQRVILEQYFEDGVELKNFQQKEMIGIVNAIGLEMINFGDRYESEAPQRKQRRGERG